MYTMGTNQNHLRSFSPLYLNSTLDLLDNTSTVRLKQMASGKILCTPTI